MFVPDPVLSLKIKPTKKEFNQKFQKAINKFKREDPTFHINQDKESEEIIMSVSFTYTGHGRTPPADLRREDAQGVRNRSRNGQTHR